MFTDTDGLYDADMLLRRRYIMEEKYNPVEEAYKLMVGFLYEGKKIDFGEVIGYLEEALDE